MRPHPAQEARVFVAPPSGISTAEWGPMNHELPISTSAYSGPWDLGLIPFMGGYLKVLDDDTIREVVLQKPSQEAGSETTLVWLKRVAVEDPGPAMWCFADEQTAQKFFDTRIKPAFESCPSIKPLIDKAKFSFEGGIVLRNGFSLVMAWASSIGKTASVSIRYLILDEICKPSYYLTQHEGKVIRRIEQRCKKFPNHKIVKLSSVTYDGDNMTIEMARTDAAYDYHVPCHACGELQPLAFRVQEPKREDDPARALDRDDHPAHERISGVVWESNDNARAAAATARYKCRSCGVAWTTAEKNRSVSLGHWVARTNSSPNPIRVGLFLSRLYSLSDGGRFEILTEEFLMAKDDVDELRSLVNNAFGEHWKKVVHVQDESGLRRAQCQLDRGVVPDEADVLTAHVDMQKTGFWYLVRAWSCRTKESWMIECGRLLDWGDVDDLLFDRTWATAGGKVHGIWRGTLDTGGSKDEHEDVSRTEQAYDWWIANRYRCSRRIFLCKGSSRQLPTKTQFSKPLEVSPSGKKLVGGLVLLFLNTNRLKDMFMHQLLQACEGGSKAARLHKDTPDQYFRHITSEAPDDNGVWTLQKGRDNHWLDCEMMAQGSVCPEIMGGLDAIGRVLSAQEPKKQPENAEKQAENSPKTGENQPPERPKLVPKPVARRPNPWTRRPGGL